MAPSSKPYRDMLQAFEEPGYWWLPGQEADKTAGTLVYTPSQGLRLNLFGTLLARREVHKSTSLPLVLGDLIAGTPVSLFDCILSGGYEHFPGYATSEYSPSTALVGWHFKSQEEAQFDELYVRVFNGEECVGISGVTKDWKFADKDRFVGYSLEYKPPEEIAFPLGNGRVGIVWFFGMAKDGMFETEVHEHVNVHLKLQEPMHYKEIFRGPNAVIHSFLELAADRHLPVHSAQFYSPACMVKYPSGDERRADISVVWEQPGVGVLQPRKKAREMMFTLNSIRDRLAQVVSRWDAFRQKHLSTVATYSMLLRERAELPWEHYFLSLVYALESYHRRSFTSPRRTVLERRIADLCEHLSPAVIPLLDDKVGFCKKVALTRNFFAHQDDRLKDRALEGWPLYACILRLEVVIRAIILKELGFADGEIEEMMRRLRLPEQIHNVSSAS